MDEEDELSFGSLLYHHLFLGMGWDGMGYDRWMAL